MSKFPPATPYYVKRALSYMREHADQTITMETLIEQSGVSARTLYAGFQRFHGATPMAFLKTERLQRARSGSSTCHWGQPRIGILG